MNRRRRILLGAIAAAALAAVGVGVLGVASGEGPAGSTAARAISVEGTATVPIGTHDNAAAATSVYREATAKALIDGQTKAAFIAEKLGAALGVATSAVEHGGYIECVGTIDEYAEYEGEQPDFGYGLQVSSGSGSGAVPDAATSPEKDSQSVNVKHPPKRKAKHKAKAAARNVASSCNLTADVAQIYAAG